MRSVIESLLLLARAEGNQLAIDCRQTDLSRVMSECWESFQPRASERGLRVELNCPNQLIVQTDPDKLRLVFNNLLDNAVSYCNPNGIVRIDQRVITDGIVIKISNSSPPLSPLEVSRLFDRFWRADASRSETGLHCGLGLALCQRLVTLLGGQISAEALEGMFIIRLFVPSSAEE